MATNKEIYRQLICEWDAMIRKGNNPNAANAHYDMIMEVVRGMIDSGEDIQLFDLYEDESLAVQLGAAAHTFELDSARATKKLEDIIAAKQPLTSMSAFYTLQELQNGKLRLRS